MDVTDTFAREISRRICNACDPERIVLFGSRARGDERAGSDFDILVVRRSSEPRFRRSAPLYTLLADLPVEVDVLVFTPEEVADWAGVPEAIVSTALREGKVLYEKP